jgi:hypothetical protein
MKLISDLRGGSLASEKLNDFKKVVYLQLVLIVTSLFLSELFTILKVPYHRTIIEMLFFIIIALYAYSLWDMTRNYTQNNGLLLFTLVFIIGIFIVHAVLHNPFYQLLSDSRYRILSLLTMTSIVMIEIIVVYFTIIEVAKSNLSITEKFWAGACIYLILGILFGGLYEIIALITPHSVIELNVELSATHFMKCIGYSFIVLSGIDNPYTGTLQIITNLSAIEAVLGNLFIVFVIGRLLYSK